MVVKVIVYFIRVRFYKYFINFLFFLIIWWVRYYYYIIDEKIEIFVSIIYKMIVIELGVEFRTFDFKV